MSDTTTLPALDRPAGYEIRVRGRLPADYFPPWTGRHQQLEGGATLSIFQGTVPDQAALHGILAQIRDLGVPLVSVTCLALR
jgi:hypothetical protein